MLKAKIVTAVAVAATVSATTISLPAPAQAASLTFQGTTYEIETIEGSFNDLEGRLRQQSWWGNPSLGANLAFLLEQAEGIRTTNGSFFAPPLSVAGPYFGESTNGSNVSAVAFLFDSPDIAPDIYSVTGISPAGIRTWAVAPTAVPTPALLPGLFGMGLATIRKRKQAQSEIV